MEPTVTLVVVCYNCNKWFDRFFSSLRAQTFIDRCEVLMVDNSSADGTAETCDREMKSWPNGRFLPTGGNLGFGGGCNFGARQARGKYLFFLNPDIWFEPDCLEQLIRHAEASSAKVFSVVELKYNGSDFTPGVHGRGASGFDIFGCTTAPSLREKVSELFAIGSFYFIRRDLFEKIGGFDEELFVYGEEMDVSWRTLIAGASIELVPAAKLHHAASGSTDQGARTTEFIRFYANRNQLLILLKNSHGLLLLLLFTHLALISVETVAGAILTRKLSFIYSSLIKPILEIWRLRRHILTQRRFIGTYRQRGDWWIARRFFSFKFGHWVDIKRFLRGGIVIDKSPIVIKSQ